MNWIALKIKSLGKPIFLPEFSDGAKELDRLGFQRVLKKYLAK
jgi:hypothetical protein